jgi:hypothetical protein
MPRLLSILFLFSMKHFTRTLFALAGFALFAQGCDDKADENIINVNNGTPFGAPKVTYVIQVVDAAGNTLGRAAGVPGANIQYRNAAGVAKAAVSDGGGNVVLTDVAPGSFSGKLEISGYATMDFITDISPASNALADSGKEYVAATRLYAIRSNATISGRVYGNYANTTGVPNPDQAANRQQVTLKVQYSLVKTGAGAYPMGAGTGRITDLNIEASTIVIETESTGDFTQADLHATKSGYIAATLSMVPYLPDNAPASFNTSFVLSQSGNNIPLSLGSAETVRLGNLLAARP